MESTEQWRKGLRSGLRNNEQLNGHRSVGFPSSSFPSRSPHEDIVGSLEDVDGAGLFPDGSPGGASRCKRCVPRTFMSHGR